MQQWRNILMNITDIIKHTIFEQILSMMHRSTELMYNDISLQILANNKYIIC